MLPICSDVPVLAKGVVEVLVERPFQVGHALDSGDSAHRDLLAPIRVRNWLRHVPVLGLVRLLLDGLLVDDFFLVNSGRGGRTGRAGSQDSDFFRTFFGRHFEAEKLELGSSIWDRL